jgi:serine/threonine-protein kinase SRPK3
MIFELVTGDYLFDPKRGKSYKKNDDHLALISELIGPCKDYTWLQTNSKCWKFYDKRKKVPKLKNISKL